MTGQQRATKHVSGLNIYLFIKLQNTKTYCISGSIHIRTGWKRSDRWGFQVCWCCWDFPVRG